MRTYILAVCTLIITMGYGCNEAMEPSVEKGSLEQLQSRYDEVGDQHNESLDFVLSSFDQLKQNNLSRDEIMDFVQGRSRHHLKSRYQSAKVKQVAGTVHDDEANRFLSASSYTSTQSAETGDSYYVRNLERPELQDAEKAYIQRIGEAIEAHDNLAGIEEQVKAILEEAEEQLTEEELQTVVVSAEVGVSSAVYWIENSDEWKRKIRELTDESENVQRDPNPTVQVRPWKGIAKSDMAGAVGGVVGSAVTGCAQLSFGACAGLGALAGGLGASSSAGARILLDTYWTGAQSVEYPKLEQ